MSLISIKNLTMDYGDGIVFKDVSFDVAKGEAVFIIGGSGCGKSTLLRCINRLITPVSGEVYINGEDILKADSDIDRIRRSMGMVYQSFNLFTHLNVLENIILAPMKVLGKSQDEAIRQAKELPERVGMTGRETAMPSQLSGGQKQRVAIARALAMNPDVILFDEPTSALDPTMVDEVEAVISDLCNDGLTSLIVTHDMTFARNTASRVIFLAEGGIYEEGTPEEIFDNPRKPQTKRFLYHSRMFEKHIDASSMDLYDLAGEMRRFLARFQFDSEHEKLISVVVDELLNPVFHSKENTPKSADIRLIGSETGRNHSLFISFPEIVTDPLDVLFIDELNLKLLEHQIPIIMSKKQGEHSYEVYIQF